MPREVKSLAKSHTGSTRACVRTRVSLTQSTCLNLQCPPRPLPLSVPSQTVSSLGVRTISHCLWIDVWVVVPEAHDHLRGPVALLFG